MPFTFAHPAVILPLLKTRKRLFSSSGLIIGSIIPDFESFIKWDEHKIYSHTWLGVFWFDLPLALIIAFVFHGVVRNAVIYNLPNFISSKLEAYVNFSWLQYFRKNFVVIIYSLLIGIVSHLLLDAFTHLNLADPDATDSQIYWGDFRLYILLQYSMSLIGLAIVGWYIIKMPKEKILNHKHDRSRYYFTPTHRRGSSKIVFWILFMVIASLTMIVAINLVEDPLNIILLIHISISAILLGLILTPPMSYLLQLNAKRY